MASREPTITKWESNRSTREQLGDRLAINLEAIAELEAAAELIADGVCRSEALTVASQQTIDLVSHYWCFEEMCRQAWGAYYLKEDVPLSIAGGYNHYRYYWRRLLESHYGWNQTMLRQAHQSVEGILSKDWRQTLAGVAGESVANLICDDTGNHRPEDLRQALEDHLGQQELEAFARGWQSLCLQSGTRNRCLTNWLEIMQNVVGSGRPPTEAAIA